METTTKVLVVEDEPLQADVIAMALRDAGPYEVLIAHSAAEGMTLARRERPALILSDYYMPEEDGFSFCRRVRDDEVIGDTMFILVTAATEVDKKVEGFESGADDYITKPYHPAELRSRVKAMLRLKALRDELQQDKEELARLYVQLEESTEGVLNLFSELIGLRIPNATIRSQRAAQMVRWMTERLGVSGDDARQYEIAARLHEIGKINLPDELNHRAYGTYTEEERRKYVQFPIYSQLLMAGIPRLATIGSYLRHQLENYDGTGYPDRLMREEIPLASRILRALNFLTEQSPDLSATAEELREKLTRARGTILEPRIAQLVEEYIRVVEDPTWWQNKRQISVYELTEGMVIAADLETGSGKKLLAQGSQISATMLERILTHHQSDPIVNGIYVYTR